MTAASWSQRQAAGCLVIGEVAQAHDGSLGMAHAYVDAIADAGADAVKFQTHIAKHESTPRDVWRKAFSRQDDSRYAYWRRMELELEHWRGLREHAHERGLLFLSSPFSLEAVALLRDIGVDAWKIASGEVTNRPLLEALEEDRLPVLLSTGMSGWAEIDRAVEAITSRDLLLTVLQCTSMYPTPAERVGIGVLAELKRRYGCRVGLSDHSGTIYGGLAAAAHGADVIEVHVAFSREVFSPDMPVSLTTTELKTLVDGVRIIPRMCQTVDKDRVAEELEPMRRLFNKSLVAARRLSAGTILERRDLALKKPGDGLPADNLERLVGRRLRRDVEADELVLDDDLDAEFEARP